MDNDTDQPLPWRDLDSDEIASVASEDLHAARPNRWRGPKSTWRALTADERQLWTSMRRLADQDLGVHLYNAFALKRRARDPATAQDLTVERDDGEQVIWAPPKLWTAWPLPPSRLPVEDFVARDEADDDDGQFTYRRRGEGPPLPSEPLREELQAAILRVAKRRFTARKRRWDAVRPSVEDNNQADDEEESEDDDEGQGGDEGEDDEYPGAAARPRRPRTFDPVVSADDDLSHALLAPSVSHAITNLDATLRILHHTRPTNGGYDSDSSTASERGKGREEKQKGKDKEKEDKEKEKAKEKEKEKEREKRKKERAHKTTNRGRPRKAHVPLDGETPEEMMLRVARENHRRVADIKRDLEFEAWMRGDSQELAEEVEGQDVKGEVAEQDEQDEQDEQEEEEEQEEQDAQPSSSESDTKEPTPPPRRTREKKRPEKRPRDRRELGLRDWSDVLGAAALAGFHPSVVARAAQRCSSLFGEGMTLRTLHEVPMPRGAPTSTGMHTASIKPLHNTRHNANDDTSEDDLSSTPSVVSRRSQPRSRRTTPSPRFGTPASSSRSRSRSASAGGLQHFCSVPGCPRAARGFPRRANLKRHVVLVHGGDTGTGRMPSSSPPGTAGGAATDPVDSDDEVVGAVHVDGFLRPVSPGRGGWQGAGWGTPTRKRKRNKARRRSSDDEHMQYDGESD